MKSNTLLSLILSLTFLLVSCETESEKRQRAEREAQFRIETEQQNEQLRIEGQRREEEQRVADAAQLEKEREEKAIYDRYINYSLNTGGTPYAICYGGNSKCGEWGCSAIIIDAPINSDVLVTIKKNDVVVRHAFISAGGSYTFEMRNGTYQPFFYYGKGWNPNKIMKQSSCGDITGGFITEESFGKDEAQELTNGSLRYTLILQENGNFSTLPSDSDEAF